MSKPDWWEEALVEVRAVLYDFTKEVQGKLEEIQISPARVLARKNPFLLRIRAVDTPELLAESVIASVFAKSEETKFGGVFQQCAEIIGRHGRSARVSSAVGIDLEWDVPGERVLVQVKSGKNWGNVSQRKQLKQDFVRARRVVKQGARISVRCIEGISYGKASVEEIDTHERLVGAAFWQELSTWEDTYMEMLAVIGDHAKNGLVTHKAEAASAITDFLQSWNFAPEGRVDWDALVKDLHC